MLKDIYTGIVPENQEEFNETFVVILTKYYRNGDLKCM